MGRLRFKYIITIPIALINRKKHVGIIGCGQFSFATIGFFLRKNQGSVIKKSYDINFKNSYTFSRYYKTFSVNRVEEIIDDPEISLVYIASNHASHTDYAIMAIEKGKDVYIEKPISTSFEQFTLLNEVISKKTSNVYVGYNRPFSKAIKEIKKLMPEERSPITLNCFIIGHVIPIEHWYRKPGEGTRVCGNLGHWIDLSVHILSSYEIPNQWDISITYSNKNESDDNLTVTIITEQSDLITLTLTSRDEPFEGINESINLQMGNLIAKIDDFRKINIWQGEKFVRRKYFRKDVGHKKAILQPFEKDRRQWKELKISTLIMLFIAEMVENKEERSTFELNKIISRYSV
ncbi:Gfo/Idh/MocA family protein [Aquimarina atlantica]|nr:Gfo/Idh/MocA family oxidoreductase [Aquimarina atlantica]